VERYIRQIPIIGEEGQKRLKKSTVTVVGVGGLGSAVVLYLTAAGVGNLILVDGDRVALSDLNRQVIHWTEDIGSLKVNSTMYKLKKLNPEVSIESIPVKLDEDNAKEYVKKSDLVIDCLDNWKTRFILNRICVQERKPFIHAGVHGIYGQLLVVLPGKSACLRCILPEPPEERTVPILSTTPGILGLLEAMEAIKILTGYGKPAINYLIIFDGFTLNLEKIPVRRREDCPVCGSLTLSQ